MEQNNPKFERRPRLGLLMRSSLALGTILMLIASGARGGGFVLKSDLNLDFKAILFREVKDGQWLAGVAKQLAHVEKNGKERLAISYFQGWNAEHGNTAYGLSLGAPFGTVAGALGAFYDKMAPELPAAPPFLKKVGDLLSLDVYVGYRPKHASDVHDLAYGIGGYVRIPVDLTLGL